MSAPDSILQLVERFKEQREAYCAGRYNETQLRGDFLDPFFEALGWDVSNRRGGAEKYREVIRESSVEVEGRAKTADYAFRDDDKILFLVEAKKPAVNIETNPEPAFQVRRYGWSAKLAISILSDFEQLAVYDCRSKPKLGDPASLGRVKLYSFLEYTDKWDEINAIFSRQAVKKGSFDQFAEGLKGKKGIADVDDAFLEEMERWREGLARNMALRNPALRWPELNSAVQTTIDRIIFLRICEEHGIEAEDTLRNAVRGKEVYQELVQIFKQANEKYNSGLFHFSEEKGQPSYPDTLTLGLKIDDKVLKDIIAHLYYPVSPYAFNYISVDILGQVYERFLGKVIRLTAGHQAKVEEKPEVRKAGGVYYTPTYIVEYIVKNTLGELLKDKTPEEQKNKPLRVIDPACGSGSFLLGAYKYLLDWNLDWYIQNDPARWSRGKAPAVWEGRGGWLLSMEKKKEILLNHIYGVDIDMQAVEVTKLSLLLKVVENPGQLSLLSERILPDLGENIKCGNSLIGPDYYDDRQMPLLADEEFYRVNFFDWQKAFPQVFAAGGFDAVIGNPPYIRIQALQEWAPTEVEFYKKRYKAASKGNYDIYVVFVEKGLGLLNGNGRLGFILPHKFFNAQYGESLRQLISTGRHLAKVVHFSDQQVFDGATTYTCLMFLEKTGKDAFDIEKVTDLNAWRNGASGVWGVIESEKATSAEWNFTVGDDSALFEKLTQMPIKLSDIAKIFVGLQTSADKIYILEGVRQPTADTVEVKDRDGKGWLLERGLLKPFLNDVTVETFEKPFSRHWLIFPYQIKDGKGVCISIKDIKVSFPKTWEYLTTNSKQLRAREGGKADNEQWYGYIYRKNLTLFSTPKLIVQVISKTGKYAFDNTDLYFTGGGNGPYYGIRWNNPDNPLSLHYLQALLSSKLLDMYLHKVSSQFRGGYWSYGKRFIEQLPFRPINFSDPADAARHARMVALVESMLALHKQAATARLPQEKEMIQRQIQATDAQIDRLVYDLYGLTEKEIKIVESGYPTST